MMTPEQLAAIQARADAATDGPWFWRTGEKFTTRLISAKNMGQYVMTFIRRGMQSADVRFNVNGIMRSANTISVPRREGDADWDERTLDHPDAIFIAHARADIPALLDEVRELRDTLRNFADAMESTHAEDEGYRKGYVDIARLTLGNGAESEGGNGN